MTWGESMGITSTVPGESLTVERLQQVITEFNRMAQHERTAFLHGLGYAIPGAMVWNRAIMPQGDWERICREARLDALADRPPWLSLSLHLPLGSLSILYEPPLIMRDARAE